MDGVCCPRGGPYGEWWSLILALGSGISAKENNEEDDDEDDEEEEDDRSLDLLARFIENVFRKISRRARKAARSVLPSSISTKLVIST
ncbi:uncharacterized protein A4U43_C03F3070 [Asparagus officinalis]|uniref:Uncharacterized protein n=1 Tax=Asparagus officinalis TaxID=4686 RepID=A0A5P1FBD1_ASPOF|nr:uncharacterized protein A4U43_C03F3070 [Asparagus officinalis]